jgi:hypothetical protein
LTTSLRHIDDREKNEACTNKVMTRLRALQRKDLDLEGGWRS